MKSFIRAGIILVFIALAAALSVAAFSHIRFYQAQLEESVRHELRLVVNMRVGQLADMLQAFRSQALLTVGNPNNNDMLLSVLRSNNGPDEALLEWMVLQARHNGYHNLIVVDSTGAVRADAKGGEFNKTNEYLPAACLEVLTEAIRTRRPQWHDVHWTPGHDHPHLELVVPVRDIAMPAGTPSPGAIIFQIDPIESVFPVLRAWPFPRRTAETYVVLPHDAGIICMTDAHKPDASPSYSSFAHTNNTAVRIFMGAEGMVSGVNYEGKKVFAKGEVVRGMSWKVVAEIAEDEVLGDLRHQLWFMAALGFALIVTAAAVLLAMEVRREHRVARESFEREQKLSVTLNSIGDAIIATDVRGRITRMNPVAEQLTGWDQCDAHGRHLDEVFRIINYFTRATVPSPVHRVLAEGKALGLANHTMLIARDGAERAIADSGAPIRDAEGNVVGVVLVFRDVTKEYERERWQCLRSAALEGSITPIGMTDLKGNITYVNAAFLAAWELDSPDQLIGRSVVSVWKDAEQAKASLAQVLEAGSWTGEQQMRGARGTERVMLVSANQVRDSQNQPFGYVASLLDITELRNLTRSLHEAKLAAESANRAKSLFLANMSHELRTPLNPIIGFADIIEKDASLSSESRKFAGLIYKRSTDLLHLINDILDLSKIEADSVTLNPEHLPLRSFLFDIAGIVEPQAKAKNLTFSWQLDADAPETFFVDQLRLRQALLNLLNNAIKFTASGLVSLQVESLPMPQDAHKVSLCFKIRDTGIGLTKENLKNLFVPFQQGDMSFSRRFGGAGLGLAISQRLIVAMGGQIEVESEEGKGALFHFTLSAPAKFEPPLPEPQKNQPTPAPTASGKGVLIVENDSSNRLVLEVLLRKAGYSCESAEDGEAGLELFKKSRPQIVLLDIQLPGMTGMDVAARIREIERLDGSHTPIVAVTAYAMHGDRERFLAAGMDAYLAKPIHAASLLATMESVMARIERSRQPSG